MDPVSRPAPLCLAGRDRARRALRRFACGAAALAVWIAAPAQAGILSRLTIGDPLLAGAAMAPALPQGISSRSANPSGGKDDTPVSFEADRVEYNDETEVVTASGNVTLHREDRSLRADTVTYDRKTGRIVARGAIRMVDEDGNQLFTEQVELTDKFETGAMQDMLLALREGGRLAAKGGERRADGKILLGKAAYTGCDVVDELGCDRKPAWKITARQVVYDPDSRTAKFAGARFVLFGARLLPLPNITIATDGRAISGLLIPNVRISSANGFELSDTYYYRIADNRDIAATAYVFTKSAPMASVQYRALTGSGAYQITGYATTSRRIPVGGTSTTTSQDFRGYLDANGRFQFSPGWSASFSGRIATDRTFLRRYFISGDDVLRSTASLSHVDKDSWFSITGWAFQTMRAGERQGLVPVALPEIDYRRRLRDPWLGGTIELQANSLAITRTAGQDTQRAFASARWDLRKVTGMGQQVTLTGLVRGDIYHSADNALTSTAIYRGNPGWQGRGVATAAIDVTWPFIGRAFGGTQVLTPHLQVVASPSIRNLAVPNEDARAIELEDDNLFALNRFPGYDRIEDGTRFTYGVDWQLEIPDWRVNATIGQSYRLTRKPTLLPSGTGLSDRLSDVVGRVDLRFRDFLKLTERFRLDKDTLAVRRHEVDATIGSERTYVEVGYARLNRQIAASLEDLQDSNELRAAGRVAFAKYWSVFASGIVDLSGTTTLPGVTAKSFQPLRTRLGFAYANDCLELGFTWRRDYVTVGDATRGNSFQIHLALKNLGLN
ncbi:MAG: LPS-assembly protein LptD [Sphingomonadales bacterium]|nr:LPS-assembly protein LptD [Sphingomonadales bacterium]